MLIYQLFAKNGLENTTMNDIAQQSGKRAVERFTPILNQRMRSTMPSSKVSWSD